MSTMTTEERKAKRELQREERIKKAESQLKARKELLELIGNNTQLQLTKDQQEILWGFYTTV